MTRDDEEKILFGTSTLKGSAVVNYTDGTPVKVGDLVGLGEDRNGVVVCSMDDGVYTEEHSKEAWGYLGRGVMIEFPKWGLIHYETREPDLELISRAIGR